MQVSVDGEGDLDLASKLKPDLYRGITEFKQQNPSDFDKSAVISYIYNEQDEIFNSQTKNTIGSDAARILMSTAQSGTDYTTTYAISIIQQINPTDFNCQAVILTPSKESADKVKF